MTSNADLRLMLYYLDLIAERMVASGPPNAGIPLGRLTELRAALPDAPRFSMNRERTSVPSWTEDPDGYLIAPLVNRGTLDAD